MTESYATIPSKFPVNMSIRVSAQKLISRVILILFHYDVIFYDHRIITEK